MSHQSIKSNRPFVRIAVAICISVLIGGLMAEAGQSRSKSDNVLGTQLTRCSTAPLTGYFRDGYCHTGPRDRGVHVVCAKMTKAFLSYTKTKGNDLSTPAPQWNFPGLKPGDKWCLCAVRWLEAQRAGKAPLVVPQATHQKALRIIKRNTLLAHTKSKPKPRPPASK